jgi:hypothetical protein
MGFGATWKPSRITHCDCHSHKRRNICADNTNLNYYLSICPRDMDRRAALIKSEYNAKTNYHGINGSDIQIHDVTVQIRSRDNTIPKSRYDSGCPWNPIFPLCD